jgi:rhodanese-related sulfurtransferase
METRIGRVVASLNELSGKGVDSCRPANLDIMRQAKAHGWTVILGGPESANYPVESGKPATDIAYVPKPRPGEMPIDEFKKIAAATPADVLILDVRDKDEANFGMIKGAKLLPDEEILDRLAEIPRDKQIVAHCSTGVRAEMAYHKLKEKGYNVKFLNANVEIAKDGSYKIEKP